MIRTLIIDDEPDAREALRLVLARYVPEVEVLALCESPQAGIEAIARLTPDLVFVDIQMPGMSGFDLVKQFKTVEFEVIFVTAFDQYAIRAIRFGALDYLLKPIDIDDLRGAITRVVQRMATRKPFAHQLHLASANALRMNGKLERIAVPTSDGIEFFMTEEIICCEADGSYTQLWLKGGQRKLVSRNLKDFEELLQDSGFCRVHHSWLINLRHVRKYVRGEGGYVIMTDDHHVDISRRRKDFFLGMLDTV
jgi:two-component system LytT family response regulator